MDLFEKTISNEIIYEGKIFNLEKVRVLLPNGKFSERDIVRHNGAVAIIAVKDNGKIVFVEQFRKPIDKVLLEVPAGKLEKNEDHEKCALRELEEETGYKAKTIKFLGEIVMTPGFADEIIYLYYASDLYKVLKGGDEDEFINLHEFDLDEINDMIIQGKIFDSKTICAIKFLENFILNNK